MAATNKTKKAELHRAIEDYLVENGQRAQERIQQGIDRARAESAAAENLARLAWEKEWLGEKSEPQPEDRRPRVVCVKSFSHRGNLVEVGSVWLANHDAVASAPSAFATVVED
jgi:hypothetical protein